MLKPVLYVGAGALALGVMLLGAGAAYTYFLGTAAAEETPPEEINEQRYHEVSFEAEDPAPGSMVGVAIQSFTSPVMPGSNATLGVRTLRSALCDISVEYDEVPSQDSGLMPKAADRFGMVSWTWTVEPGAPVGKWPVEVTCSFEEQSGVMKTDLVVSYDSEE